VPPRAVTFDLWHTLLYLAPEDEDRYMERQMELGEQALARAIRDSGAPDRSPAELRAAFEVEYLRAVEASGRGVTVTPARQVALAGGRTGRHPAVPEYLEELAQLVRATPFRVAPGALELLRSLSDDGYRLAVVSNTVGEPGALFRPLLRSSGFDRYVRAYAFSDEHPWSKPAPEIFQAALASLGVQRQDAVHVGDGWSDLEGARRAGFRAGVLFTGLKEYGAKYRELFASTQSRPSTPEFEADTLEGVGRIVRDLLPTEAPGGAAEK
jgi:HAD superfamily hydrolase (TIGR01549 family)